MTVLKQPYKIVIDWSMTLFWKALTWQLMAMCHWLQSITRNLWPSVIDCDQWQKNYGQSYKNCHWPRSMTKKSVIDWMYTIYGYFGLASKSQELCLSFGKWAIFPAIAMLLWLKITLVNTVALCPTSWPSWSKSADPEASLPSLLSNWTSDHLEVTRGEKERRRSRWGISMNCNNISELCYCFY